MRVQDRVDGLVKLLNDESDRGLALVGAATIDLCLEALLRGHFVEGSNISDELLGVDRPLATFSSRIKLCYALGLIDRDEYGDLESLRAIRNAAAHTAEPFDLGSLPHSDRIRDLAGHIS